MAPPEANYPTISKALDLQKNDFKSNLMKMIEASKEEMNKAFKKYRKIYLNRKRTLKRK